MSLSVRSAETSMSRSVSGQTARIKVPALHAAQKRAKSNSPPFHPEDPVPVWIWVVHLQPARADPTAGFREPDDPTAVCC